MSRKTRVTRVLRKPQYSVIIGETPFSGITSKNRADGICTIYRWGQFVPILIDFVQHPERHLAIHNGKQTQHLVGGLVPHLVPCLVPPLRTPPLYFTLVPFAPLSGDERHINYLLLIPNLFFCLVVRVSVVSRISQIFLRSTSFRVP